MGTERNGQSTTDGCAAWVDHYHCNRGVGSGYVLRSKGSLFRLCAQHARKALDVGINTKDGFIPASLWVIPDGEGLEGQRTQQPIRRSATERRSNSKAARLS